MADELGDGVLLGRERALVVARDDTPPLHRLARRPVLAVGEVPEVDGERRVEAGRGGDVLGGEQPLALDGGAVGAIGSSRCVIT